MRREVADFLPATVGGTAHNHKMKVNAKKLKMKTIKLKKVKAAKKRRHVQHKKTVATKQLNDLRLQVRSGNEQARAVIDKKIKELQDAADTKKTRKDLKRYKKILSTVKS